MRLTRPRFALRKATARLRVLPHFIVLGAARAGTTTFYTHIVKHPQVLPAWRKEVHFFDNAYREGLAWYKAFFPTRGRLKALGRRTGSPAVTGEASPSYLVHPLAPRRAWSVVPEARLVVLLRNPSDRAISHYCRRRAPGLETAERLTFEGALDAEPERLALEDELLRRDGDYPDQAYSKMAYLRKGIYVDQIRTWRRYFPSNQMLILHSKDLFKRPEQTFPRVCEFLDMPSWAPKKLERTNFGAYKEPPAHIRERLDAYFRPHNRRLFEYLGVDWDWPT